MEEAFGGERYSPRLVALAHMHQDAAKQSLVDARQSIAGPEPEVVVDGNNTTLSTDFNHFKSAQWYVTSQPTSNTH